MEGAVIYSIAALIGGVLVTGLTLIDVFSDGYNMIDRIVERVTGSPRDHSDMNMVMYWMQLLGLMAAGAVLIVIGIATLIG